MSKRDATPSWSGFIFQGEVAICVALEKIMGIGVDNLTSRNALLIESDEDFSIRENELEVYQVKAIANSSMSAFKNTVEELINRYTYSIKELKDPADGRKTIRSQRNEVRNKPIKSYLVSWYNITDWDKESFDDRFSAHIDTSFSLISGVYTVENIEDKTKIEIEKVLNHIGVDFAYSDLDIIYAFLCGKVDSLIKDSHSKKVRKEIPFTEIINDIKNAPKAYNVEIGWHYVKRNFFHAMMEELNSYKDLNSDDMLEKKGKIDRVILELGKLDDAQFKGLLENNLIPHKDLKGSFSLIEFGDYLNKTLVIDILCRAITSINDGPNYASLAFTCKKTHNIYQATLLNRDIPDDERYSSQLMEEVEKLAKKPVSNDVSFFINQHLNLDLNDAKDVLNNIFTDLALDGDDSFEENRVFGLRKIDKASNELNA
ncbi:hypothetical protein ACFSYG_04105 [Leeuwenhoekiella polynyae]|uniref:Uncharacterized protein n=1 Tax=Leeuwenhoekiella polynyae TaxID=1550906 RepID=A0A4Q0P2V4_9FLAO|nr:hypothetical protein [Leeuwenhoekiella polynyae]RXG20893.1 hypothetical protein DSM02_2264 [Leeuwenhoekiella polynyae]